jgi:hypothetical protein
MAELINANPTVFAPSQTSIRKPSKKATNLWLGSDDDSEFDRLDEPEPIDEQEIFGESAATLVFTSYSHCYRFNPFNIRS